MNNNLSDPILIDIGKGPKCFTAIQLFEISVHNLSICTGMSRTEAKNICLSYIKDKDNFLLNKERIIQLFNNVRTVQKYEYQLLQISLKLEEHTTVLFYEGYNIWHRLNNIKQWLLRESNVEHDVKLL